MLFQKTEDLIIKSKINFLLAATTDLTDSFSSHFIWDSYDTNTPSSIVQNIYESFEEEYNGHISKFEYFYGCTFEVYKQTYDDRLKKHLNEFADSNELDFLTEELHKGIELFLFPFTNYELNKNINYSLKRRKEFITEKINSIGYSITFFTDDFGRVDSFKIDKVQHPILQKESIQEVKLILPHKDKPKKTLKDFINNVNDKDSFIEELSKTFNIEKGISIKILIELLKDENIILIPSRGFKSFYNCLKDKFNRDIGTYTALNDLYKHSEDNKIIYKTDIEQIHLKLKPLLTYYKTN